WTMSQASVSSGSGPAAVPRIHMTLKDTDDIPPQVQKVIDSWKTLNPDWKLVLYNDRECRAFVEAEYPEFLSLYDNVFTAVERSDIWRYLIIHRFGGLYIDSDVLAVKPISEWMDVIRDKVGPESMPAPGKMNLLAIEYARDGIQFSNWWLYGQRGNSLFYNIVRDIRLRFLLEVAHGSSFGDAVSRTGPERLTATALTRLHEHEIEIAEKDWQEGDDATIRCYPAAEICILGRQYMGIANDRHDYSERVMKGLFSKHLFAGSWKMNNRLMEARIALWKLHKKWDQGKVVI
ncbi:MAG: hypothetical protein SGCHY_003071, partial [Lobulomycetales sp.]